MLQKGRSMVKYTSYKIRGVHIGQSKLNVHESVVALDATFKTNDKKEKP